MLLHDFYIKQCITSCLLHNILIVCNIVPSLSESILVSVFELPGSRGLNPQLFSQPPNTLTKYVLGEVGISYVLYTYIQFS